MSSHEIWFPRQTIYLIVSRPTFISPLPSTLSSCTCFHTHTTGMKPFELQEAAKCKFSVITLQPIDMTIIQMSRMVFCVRQFISESYAKHDEGHLYNRHFDYSLCSCYTSEHMKSYWSL